MRDDEGRAIAQQLAALPSFEGCTAKDLADLARSSHHSSVPAGWPLIHQDTPADACYVILSGTVSVAIDGNDVAELGSGSIVGEMALATGRLRNATVTSTTPLDLLHIDVTQFRSLLDRRPALRTSMLARLAAATA